MGAGAEPPTSPVGGPAQALWQLWRQGLRPDVWSFLAEAGPLPLPQVAAVLVVDQQERWQAGERVPAELYLQRHPALEADRERAVELIYREFLLRDGLGEAPAPAEYLGRFPAYAERLRQQFELRRALDTVTSGEPTEGPAPRAWPDVPGHEIRGELGRGGMAVVFRARQTDLDRVIALKMIRAGGGADPEERARFRREAEAVACLQHPNVVQIHAV